MNRSLVLATLALAAVPAAQERVTVDGTVKVADPSNRNAPPPVVPPSESVTLGRAAPKGGGVALEDGWFGTCKIGGKAILVAVGKSDAALELPDLICVDLDGDGAIADAERIAIEVATQDSRGTTVARAAPVDVEFSVAGGTLPVRVGFMRFGDREPSVALQFPNYLEASVTIGGKARIVAVVDKDYDGRFGSAGDLWALAEPGGRSVSAYGLSGIGERSFQDGVRIGIEVQGTKIAVRSEPAAGPDPKDEAAHRARVEHYWMERFDQEREGFVAQRGLDTSRPLAKQPIDWKYVTFDEALELGRKTGKPVFIDVMAFWCVWCYRMDYYTYPDAEVAALLGGDFVPVKIIQEQDRAGDYDRLMKEKLEARGIPAMGVFRADGSVVHKIGGWKKPEEFIAELKAAKAAFAGN